MCGNDRVVESSPISLPNLPRRLREGDQQFVVAAYLYGPYLDANVADDRTRFLLPVSTDGDEQLLIDDTLSLNAIKSAALKEVDAYLGPHLMEAGEMKVSRIRKYIETTAPEYRPLLNHPEQLADIPVELEDDELEAQLHLRRTRVEREARDAVEAIVEDEAPSADGVSDAQLEKLIGTVTEFGKSELVRYVAMRKLVLDLLEKALKLNPGTQKYSLEKQIHQLVCPLGVTSNEVPFDRLNLWILDEKLAYHQYLASDRFISGGKDTGRPDLVVFNRPLAFGDGPTQGSVVIVEFKRPQRDDYSDSDNPIEQVYRYIREIRDGKAKTKDGRPIPVTELTPFYAYVVADLTPTLRTQAENAGFHRKPDEVGYYFYNTALRAFVDITSYDQALDDAKKRNRAFIDRLGAKP